MDIKRRRVNKLQMISPRKITTHCAEEVSENLRFQLVVHVRLDGGFGCMPRVQPGHDRLCQVKLLGVS